MSIRFQTQGPRVTYDVVQQQKPGQQLMGLYNTWQSLAPHTRDWITSGFGLFSDEPTDEYGFTEDDYDKNGNIKRSTKDKEKLLDEIGDRETVIPEEEYQSWEGLIPTDIEVGSMDPHGIFADGPIEAITHKYGTSRTIPEIFPSVIKPSETWGIDQFADDDLKRMQAEAEAEQNLPYQVTGSYGIQQGPHFARGITRGARGGMGGYGG